MKHNVYIESKEITSISPADAYLRIRAELDTTECLELAQSLISCVNSEKDNPDLRDMLKKLDRLIWE